MTFPPDLPGYIEYRVGSVVLTALPRTPIEYLGSSGKTNAAIVKPTIPLGCSGWRLGNETEWKPIRAIPLAWMPFLNRKRPSPMDPRKPLRVVPHDAIEDGGGK